ncbi:MAG: helix-turn-helix domain-containing protein, partial [Gemmataceae bacterium]
MAKKGYLTLEEAAEQLGMDVDELSQMANRREVRAFADRGTWRFKKQDIEDMLSQRNALQDEDAPIPLIGDDPFDAPMDDFGDEGPPSTGSQPTSVKRRSTDKHGEDELFEFELSMDSSSFELDAGEDMGLPPSPPAATTGGSEMHMVFDDDDFGTGAPKTNLSTSGSMEVKTGLAGSQLADSESVFVDEGTGVKTSVAGGPSPYDRKTMQSFDEGDEDSASVGLGEDVFTLDSEVDLPAADSDSLEVQDQLMPTTEEVPVEDLDLQMREEEAGDAEFGGGSSSPFELSEDDLDEAPPPPTSSFESSSFDDDEVELGDLTPGSDFSSGASGINLHSPADTGVGLEKSGPISGVGGDEIEFELSLDADATPAPSHGESDSSEFELTLDDDDFSSEGSTTSELAGEEKDIFETDDNIPALDEEDSGSEAVALEEVDTDLESSDFDFSGEEASQSEVVALDEEEPVSSVSSEDEMSMEVDDVEDEEEEEPATAAVGAGAPALPPASWGALPVIFLAPSVIVLFLLGQMTFEMLHGKWGYK